MGIAACIAILILLSEDWKNTFYIEINFMVDWDRGYNKYFYIYIYIYALQVDDMSLHYNSPKEIDFCFVRRDSKKTSYS